MIYFFVFLSILISFIALGLTLLSPGKFALDDALDLLGVTITGVAFIIGCFFAFKAIQAYSQIRKIEKQIEETKKIKHQLTIELKQILSTRDKITSDIVDTINFMHEVTGESVMNLLDLSSEKNNREKILEKSHQRISLQRGNLFYLKLLPIEERKKALMYIITFGNKSDLERLEKIISDTTESTDIRKLANDAFSRLLIQLRKEQRNQDSPHRG